MPQSVFTVHYSAAITQTMSAIYFLHFQSIWVLTSGTVRSPAELLLLLNWDLFLDPSPDTFLGMKHYNSPSHIFSKGINCCTILRCSPSI